MKNMVFIFLLLFIITAPIFSNSLVTNGTLLIGFTELEDFDENWSALDFDSGKVLFSSRKKGAKLLGDLYWDNCDQGIYIGGMNYLRKDNIIDLGNADFDKTKQAPITGYKHSMILKVDHVYCFKTDEGNYAKIKIISMNKEKTKIKVKWVFQKNGTNKF